MSVLLTKRKENIFVPKQLLNLPCIHHNISIVMTCKFYYSHCKSKCMENIHEDPHSYNHVSCLSL